MTPILLQARTRSKFEAKLLSEILARDPNFNVDDHYESTRLAYTVPARKAHYIPDLWFADRRLVIEMKGRFRDVDERMKYVHFAKSNPDIEIRFVLQRAGLPIYKGSKTTQEQWLAKHSFKYAIGTIPPEWLA